MANLKVDLINKITNDKYFDELELARLAQEPNMNYKQKIEEMDFLLSQIFLSNAKIELITKQYFVDQPVTQVQNHGASHVE
jgi:hypothetical protein